MLNVIRSSFIPTTHQISRQRWSLVQPEKLIGNNNAWKLDLSLVTAVISSLG